MLTDAQRRELIEKIRSLPARLEAVIAPLTEEQLTTRFIEGEWAVAQNVHHLADAHINSFIRLKLILTEERPTLKPFDQNRWAETVDATAMPVQASLALLKGLHIRWAMLFETLQEADWQRVGIHPERGELTPEDLLVFYAGHGEEHIEQIRKTLAAQRARV